MSKKIFSILKYILLLSATAGLFWYAIGNIEVQKGQTKWEYLVEVWKSADKIFLILCVVVGIASHWVRAVRWKILLEPLGYNLNVRNGFFAVMTGYFVNLVIPRGGEISRCYNIYKMDKIPVDTSVGTVLAERLVDLIFMIVFIGIAFCIEVVRVDIFDLISHFSLDSGAVSKPEDSWLYAYPSLYAIKVHIGMYKSYYYLGLLIAMIAGIVALFKFFPEKASQIKAKVQKILVAVKDGAMAIFKLKRRAAFFGYSWLIWGCYCLMTYFIILAFKETSGIGVLGSITVFTTGGIAMTIPMPGGTGSYHVLVPFVMEQFYQIKNATGYAVIFHGWQTLVIIVVGAFSLIMSQVLTDTSDDQTNEDTTKDSTASGSAETAKSVEVG